MSRKYSHRGYRDTDREEKQDSSRRPPRTPRDKMDKDEYIRRKSMRHAIDRDANEILRCPTCGGNVRETGTIARSTTCPHCQAALHCCRACKHFDSGARFQCRADVEAAVGDKNKANDCAKFAPSLVLDVTGRRTKKPTAKGRSNDPRAAFDDLFKR